MSLIKKPRKAMIEKREQFKVMAAAGLKYSVIGTVLNICPATIKNWRKEYDIPRRKHGRKPAVKAAVTNG
jgi:uncharacterized protein YjcR